MSTSVYQIVVTLQIDSSAVGRMPILGAIALQMLRPSRFDLGTLGLDVILGGVVGELFVAGAISPTLEPR